MTRGLINWLLVAIAIFIMVGCGEQTKEVRLVFKFPSEKVYHYMYDSKSSTVVTENDKQTLTGEKSNRITYTQEVVKNIDNTTARLLFSYSQTDEETKTEKNWSTTCIMATDGNITEFKPDSNISDETFEYYRQLFEQTSPVYPHEPVPEGYSWTNRYTVLLDKGKTEASTTYKIKAFAREAGYDCAVIEYKGTMIIPLGSNPMGDGSVKISGADHIDVEGVSYFSYTTGILVRQEETTHLVREGTQQKENKSITFRIEENRNNLTRLVDITNK